MTDKLLPCPFCGGSDVGFGRTGQKWQTVACNECGAEGPCTEIDRKLIIEKWNTRATPSPIGADEIQSGAIGARTREVMIRQVESKMLQIPYDEGTVAFRQRRTKELAVEAVDAILALSGPLQNDT